MRKLDAILALITGGGVGILFAWFVKDSALNIPYWLFPISLPFLSLFSLWIAYLIGKKFLFVFQLAKFLLIGTLFALFDLVVLNALMRRFGITAGVKYSILVGVSFIIATIIKYIADKYWAFEKTEGPKVISEFSIFFIITLISGGIQIAVASFIVNILGPRFGISSFVWANIGKIGGIIIASAWNFIGYKFLVFKK